VQDGSCSIAVSTKRKSEIFFREGLDKTGKSGRCAFTSSVMRGCLNACDAVVQRNAGCYVGPLSSSAKADDPVPRRRACQAAGVTS
jgi:hypothetical protein